MTTQKQELPTDVKAAQALSKARATYPVWTSAMTLLVLLGGGSSMLAFAG